MNPARLFVPPSPRPRRAPRWAKYSAVVDTAVRLSWGDRLRALIGGAVVVRTWIALEHKPGRIDCASRIYTDPLVKAEEKKTEPAKCPHQKSKAAPCGDCVDDLAAEIAKPRDP